MCQIDAGSAAAGPARRAPPAVMMATSAVANEIRFGFTRPPGPIDVGSEYGRGLQRVVREVRDAPEGRLRCTNTYTLTSVRYLVVTRCRQRRWLSPGRTLVSNDNVS